MTETLVGGAAAPLSIRAAALVASAVVGAARQLLTDLERGRRIEAAILRDAMEAAFRSSDASGTRTSKTAYDAGMAATVLFLFRYRAALRAEARSAAAKFRQVAGFPLDNWLTGRRRAICINQSDKFIENAQRNWSALGVEEILVRRLSRYRQGTPVRLADAIPFTAYATLRTDERREKLSRVEWLGSDADGVIVFDNSNANSCAIEGVVEREGA
jgi:hypothetical protein